MFRLLLRIAALVLLAVGVPFAWHHKQKITESVGGVWNSAPGSDFDSAFDELVTRGTSMVPPSLAAASIPDRTSPPARDSQGDPLERVLSFNVTHQWVTQNFSRVSTIRTEPHLVGLRVAYVGGKRLDDVSGSLTYYFDAQASLRRITLMGRTGDPQHLLKIVQGTYGMLKEPHLRAGLFVARWNAVPMSALWITYADVIRSDQPYSRFEFRLEINRPSMGYQLSPQFQALLKADSRYDKPFVSAPRSAPAPR